MTLNYIVGIDEVGRGPLAGPVTFCAVRVRKDEYVRLKKLQTLPKRGLDSKKLTAEKREMYARELKRLYKEKRIEFSVVSISNKIIDSRGLSYAIKKALAGCLRGVSAQVTDQVLLDGGLKIDSIFLHQKTIIKGDEKEPVIAWASILAKVTRDSYMGKMARMYPHYGFQKHVGYGTAFHRKQIQLYGPSAIHRVSFLKNITLLV